MHKETFVESQELDLYLVIQLSDVLFNVWQQPPESEFLDKLSDVVMVTKGQTGPVAPSSWQLAVCIPSTSLQVSADITKSV